MASAGLIDAIGGGWKASSLQGPNDGVKERLSSTVDMR